MDGYLLSNVYSSYASLELTLTISTNSHRASYLFSLFLLGDHIIHTILYFSLYIPVTISLSLSAYSTSSYSMVSNSLIDALIIPSISILFYFKSSRVPFLPFFTPSCKILFYISAFDYWSACTRTKERRERKKALRNGALALILGMRCRCLTRSLSHSLSYQRGRLPFSRLMKK